MHLEGTATAPGAWGRILNGGASLIVDGAKVDIRYRDIDAVRHWIGESQSGRFEVDGSNESLAGIPPYTLAASTTSLHTRIDSPKRDRRTGEPAPDAVSNTRIPGPSGVTSPEFWVTSPGQASRRPTPGSARRAGGPSTKRRSWSERS